MKYTSPIFLTAWLYSLIATFLFVSHTVSAEALLVGTGIQVILFVSGYTTQVIKQKRGGV